MARKNHLRSEASGSIQFDARTKTVMAGATQDNIKEKVQSVREVMPGKSNNEVHMVLQYYDYSVERAIQAYLEDGAKEALGEWSLTRTKHPNKRKNKKKGAGEKPASSSLPASVDEKDEAPGDSLSRLSNGDSPPAVSEPKCDTTSEVPDKSVPDSILANDITPAGFEPKPSAAKAVPAEPLPQRQLHGRGKRNDSHTSQPQHLSGNEKPPHVVSSRSDTGDGNSRKPQQGLEKAIKDLHRQTTSLERLRHVLDHEIDRSYKSMKTVFEELRQGLNAREVQLMTEMSVLKQEASDMLETRQNKAADFKKQIDRSDKLREADVSQLRAEIKHFVSERRHDEELGRTTRFLYDSDHMMDEIQKFGQVVHVKPVYTAYSVSNSSLDSCENNQATNLSSFGHQPHSPPFGSSHSHDRLKQSAETQNAHRSRQPEVQPQLIQNGSGSSDGAASSSPSPPRPSAVVDSGSRDGDTSIQAPSFSDNNNDNFSRRAYGDSIHRPRGRGRGQGSRGLGRGRGGFNRDRPRPQQHSENSNQHPSGGRYDSKERFDARNSSQNR